VLGAAARQRGIDLQWIYCPEGPQKALAAGKVDLWPLLASRAAYEAGFYTADPWLQNEYSIIWRGTGSGWHDDEPDWKGRTVAVTNLPWGVRLAKQSLPGSAMDLTPNRVVSSHTFARAWLMVDLWRCGCLRPCCATVLRDAPTRAFASG
jgi:hypothetical protein